MSVPMRKSYYNTAVVLRLQSFSCHAHTTSQSVSTATPHSTSFQDAHTSVALQVQAQWLMSISPAHGRLRQEDCFKCEVRLDTQSL